MIHLSFPPSTNNLYRNAGAKGRVKTDHYNRWLAEAAWLVRQQRPAAIEGSYNLAIIADRPDRRARDIDNLIKPTSDLLKKAGVITDDSLAKSVSAAWSDAEPKKPGGVRVSVEAA